MRCPKCDQPSRVIDTDPRPLSGAIRRRRLCAAGHRFTTYEIHASAYATARSADRTYQQYLCSRIARAGRLLARATRILADTAVAAGEESE